MKTNEEQGIPSEDQLGSQEDQVRENKQKRPSEEQ